MPCLKIYAEKYAADQDAFFEDYAEAHAKLSNLGAKFDPPKVNEIKDFLTSIIGMEKMSSQLDLLIIAEMAQGISLE